MTTRRPPVIPEIAKAYQNDPQTLLARAAMEAGSSTAPVAGGKYAFADGIARALQGVAGGYIDKRQQDKYAKEEVKTVADQQDILRRTLAAQTPPPALHGQIMQGPDGPVQGPIAPPAPPPVQGGSPAAVAAPSPQAAAVAAALGAPPVPPAPPGPPTGAPTPIPMAPVPPAVPAPVQGGGPTGRRPFGPAPANANPLAPPVPEAVPDAPKVLERPNAPEAVGPTRSKLLDAAYATIMNGNPYLFAGGQGMYREGMADQTKLDETAAERRQRLLDMGYQSDLGQYADSQSQARGATYAERQAAQGRNFQAGEAFKGRAFQAGESAKERAQDTWRTKYSAGTQFALQRSQQAFQASQAEKGHGYDMELEGAKIAGKRADRASGFFSTAAGSKIYDAAAAAVGNANQQIGTLNEIEKRLKTTKTGGLLLGNAPGLVKWSNSDMQVLDAMVNDLALGKATSMKGSLSDKDVAFLQSMGPSIKKTRTANLATVQRLRGIAQRTSEFQTAKIDAMANGEGPQFLHDWSAYSNAVPAGANTDFETWRTSRPKFNANGELVK